MFTSINLSVLLLMNFQGICNFSWLQIILQGISLYVFLLTVARTSLGQGFSNLKRKKEEIILYQKSVHACLRTEVHTPKIKVSLISMKHSYILWCLFCSVLFYPIFPYPILFYMFLIKNKNWLRLTKLIPWPRNGSQNMAWKTLFCDVLAGSENVGHLDFS